MRMREKLKQFSSAPSGSTQKAFYVLVVLISLWFLLNHASKISFNWGYIPPVDEIYLTGWGAQGQFTVYSSNPKECSLCGGKVGLVSGKNILEFDKGRCGQKAELVCGNLNLSFYPSDSVPGPNEKPKVEFESYYANGSLNVRLHGQGKTGGYAPLEFFVDSESVHFPAILLNGTFDFVERIKAPPGKHQLAILLSGTELYRSEFEIPGKPFPFELLLVLLLSFGITALLFRSGWPLHISITAFAVLFIFGSVYVFVFANNFRVPWVVSLFYAGVFAWVYKKRR